MISAPLWGLLAAGSLLVGALLAMRWQLRKKVVGIIYLGLGSKGEAQVQLAQQRLGTKQRNVFRPGLLQFAG